MNISIEFCQNICIGFAVNGIFHFPHYKSMEPLSYYSTKRKANFNKQKSVTANMINIL